MVTLRVFFAARAKRPHDTARMHGEAAPGADALGQGGHAQRGVGVELIGHKGPDGRGELVGASGALLGWKEPRQPGLRVGRSAW